MHRRRNTYTGLALGTALVLSLWCLEQVAPAWAGRGERDAAGPGFELSWFTIDGGGVTFSESADNRYVLSATIGQPDAGKLSNGDYELTGGFWFAHAPGDCNTDGGVNLFDYHTFADCASGPDGSPLSAECACFDLDGSGAVDLADFGPFQAMFSGS